ncbi:nuclear transport factor 2 family protein [Pedobacter alpinus]|uniref:Nuclear transport factor 2 family protein n=1 Tax=Pedobacter alpinus TaxID=1590643 RepID=A0ABW5TMB1_9SPHI
MMKTINLKKSFVAIMMMVATFSFTKADELTEVSKSMTFSINSYINLIKDGETKGMEKLFADDVKFNITRGNQILSHGKNEELNFLAKNKNLIQQCSVVSSVMMNSSNYSLVKVSMIYDNFTRENYVTMIKSGKDWKITEVSSEFK